MADLETKGDGGVIVPVFDHVDGLPRHPNASRQLRLRNIPFLSRLFHFVVDGDHSLSIIFDNLHYTRFGWSCQVYLTNLFKKDKLPMITAAYSILYKANFRHKTSDKRLKRD